MRKGVSQETFKMVLIFIALLLFLALVFSYFIGEGGIVSDAINEILELFKVVR